MNDALLNFLIFALGIVGNLIASALWDRWKEGPQKEELWKSRLQSTDSKIQTQAFRECALTALRWYVIANILWVISGVAWALEVLEGVGIPGALIGRVVMIGTALVSLLFFGVALSWIRRALKYKPDEA